MSQTVIRGTQILNNTVQRQDLDTSTVGQAVVTKLVQGTNVTLSSTGADSGTGDVTVSASGGLADAPNDANTYGRHAAAWLTVLPITGGTVTGPLTVLPPAGQGPVCLTLTGNPTDGWAQQYFNKASGTSGVGCAIVTTVGGSPGYRWALSIGDNTVESGGNAGSDYKLEAYSDAGASLGVALKILRASLTAIFGGPVTLAADPTSALGAATKQYVDAKPGPPAPSSTTPVMDGTAAIGAGTTYARADHVHPSDTSRMAVGAAPTAHEASHVTGSDQIPLASSSTKGLLNQTSGNTTDFIDGTNNSQPLQPVIWSARLRSFNAVQNSTFEVDQRNVGNVVTNPATGTFIIDRWIKGGSGTYTVNARQFVPSGGPGIPYLPGTNFRISANWFQVVLTAQEASLAASDYLCLRQQPEGIRLRELIGDVHSVSLLVASTVAPLTFAVALRDVPGTRSLIKLCTITTANVWTLITLPNLPLWPAAGTFNIVPGLQGYDLAITLACGSTSTAPAADTWQTGNFISAPGVSNFCAQAVNSVFYLGFVQHEPGAQCTTPIDCPFTQNYDECLRYFCKSLNYATAPGGTGGAAVSAIIGAGSLGTVTGVRFPKPMAKQPTATCYSNSDGTINAVRDVTSASNRAVSSVTADQTGILQVNLSASSVAGNLTTYHYTSDTGW